MPAALVQAGVGLLQAGIGAIQSIGANKRLKQLRQRRVAYQTPQEVFDAQYMALNEAQTGLGPQSTAAYKNQMDKGLSSSLGTATSLGANPNNIADILDRNQQGALDFSIKNEAMRYNKYTNLLSTIMAVAQGKTAEWASKDNNLKDDMAAEKQKAEAGNKNLQSGLNMALGGIANNEASKLYNTNETAKTNAFVDYFKSLTNKPATATTSTSTTQQRGGVGMGDTGENGDIVNDAMVEQPNKVYNLDDYFDRRKMYKFQTN